MKGHSMNQRACEYISQTGIFIAQGLSKLGPHFNSQSLFNVEGVE